ncbi:hypothetical protein CYMTET_24452 [Cymbomonas tetramitiformis]|uniref:Myb-like domain-containing protein n=1 Tax=Cymbomonas tetramitiformis TaxID=36881 RepID=A0AAE0FWK0_9CHLO|nr:hypothetical protein CYMTET_24452 [Cymbomonas tetramitiformis]
MSGSGFDFQDVEIRNWSRAKRNAWDLRHKAPNEFLYRFPLPGVPQLTGSFSASEAEAFQKRCEEFKTRGWPIGSCWGLFSFGVPGRVGYQCRAHWSRLHQGEPPSTSSVSSSARTAARDCLENHRELLAKLWSSPAARKLENKVNLTLVSAHAYTENAADPSASKGRGTGGIKLVKIVRQRLGATLQSDSDEDFQDRKKSSKRKRLSAAPGEQRVLNESAQNGSAASASSMHGACESPAKRARPSEGAGFSGPSRTASTAFRAPSALLLPTASVSQTSPLRVSSAAAAKVHSGVSAWTARTNSHVGTSHASQTPQRTVTKSEQHVPEWVAIPCSPDTGSVPQASVQTLPTRDTSTQRLSAARCPLEPGSTVAASTSTRTTVTDGQETSNSSTSRPQPQGQQADPGPPPAHSPDELRAPAYQHSGSSRSPQRLGCMPTVRLRDASAAHSAIPETPRQQYGSFPTSSTRPSPSDGQGSGATPVSLSASTDYRSCEAVPCSPCRTFTPPTPVAAPVQCLQRTTRAPPCELTAAAKLPLTTQAVHHSDSHVASAAQHGAATQLQPLLHPSRWTKLASTACSSKGSTSVSQHKPGPCARKVGAWATWTSSEQKVDELDRIPRKCRGIRPAKEATTKALKRASPGHLQVHQPRPGSVPRVSAAKDDSDEDDDFVTGSLYCPKPKAEECVDPASPGISRDGTQQQDCEAKGASSMRVMKLGPAPSGTWTRVIQPYTAHQPAEAGGPVIAAPDLLEYNYEVLGGGFLGVLLSPPLVDALPASGAGGTPMLTSTQLARLPFGGGVVIPCGLVFVEVPHKEHIPEMVKCMDSWGFRYVESCTRVWLGTDNSFLQQEAPYFRRSHSTVLIGRKGDTLELRHQRSPDVVVEHRREEDTGMAHSIKEMIEILLPEANPNRTSTPRLLELCWTKRRTQNMIVTVRCFYKIVASLNTRTSTSHNLNR